MNKRRYPKPIPARLVKPGFWLKLSCADMVLRWLRVVSVQQEGDWMLIKFPRIMGTAKVCHEFRPSLERLVVCSTKRPEEGLLADGSELS